MGKRWREEKKGNRASTKSKVLVEKLRLPAPALSPFQVPFPVKKRVPDPPIARYS